MNEQLTFFDFFDDIREPEYPPIIAELDKELATLFTNQSIRDKSYEVWSHVPALGKRYCIWVDIKDKQGLMSISFESIIQKYKKKHLEVSVIATGCSSDGCDHSLMISTLWTTKNHKEIA